MGTTKKYPYKESIIETARTAHSIGHPARFTILRHLLRHNTGTPELFCHLTTLSRSTISQHLKEMEAAKIIYRDYMLYESQVFLHKKARNRIQKMMNSISLD
jgi:DNA-binding HxlR family transcriptional regulator